MIKHTSSLFRVGVAVMACLLFFSSQTKASTVVIDLLGKLQTVEEHQPDPKKRLTAKYQIIHMMTKCEFDEKCLLKMKDQLEIVYKQDKNVMYRGFIKYLDWEKNDLEYNLKNCQLDEKKAMRKIYAQCYEAWIEEEVKPPVENRQTMDINESKRSQCIWEKAKPLAEQGNIFAQAEMVKSADQEMSKWAAQIQNLSGTPKYEQYMKCSELP